MALCAVINNALVIKHGGRKSAWHVTDAAILGRGHMTGTLLSYSSGGTIGMTFVAVIHPASVIKHTIGKAGANAMADSAIFSRIRMRRRRIVRLSKGVSRRAVGTIVARFTIASNTRMCEIQRAKGIVRMTEVTILRGWHMSCRLNQRRPGCKESTDVATFTTRYKVDMHIGQEH